MTKWLNAIIFFRTLGINLLFQGLGIIIIFFVALMFGSEMVGAILPAMGVLFVIFPYYGSYKYYLANKCNLFSTIAYILGLALGSIFLLRVFEIFRNYLIV